MKTAYELAMERLSKNAPAVKLTAGQKQQIAELESRCKARIAEREIASHDEITRATEAGEAEKVAELEQKLVNERKKLLTDLEDKKDAIRRGKG